MSNSERTLDTTGLFCPEPVMMLHNQIRAMASGERVRVLATDPSTRRDIPKFCNYLGHELLEELVVADRGGAEQFVYLIQKA